MPKKTTSETVATRVETSVQTRVETRVETEVQTRVETEIKTKDRFSEPAHSNAALQQHLRGREDLLDSIPSIPTILQTLVDELDQPSERVDLLRVADLISRDESLTAQCLRMANSALFSRGKPIDSIRGAIRTLGIAHTRDVAISCTLMRIGTAQRGLDPIIFWEHSLGCAILSRKLARSVGFENPDKAYLAGLLHDIGYIVNLILAPQQMKSVLEEGSRDQIFAGEVEHSVLGFTHCQSGELLARKWHLTADIVEVIQCHHNPMAAVVNPALVAIVALTDQVCRSSNLGLGYTEAPDPALTCAGWQILAQACPRTGEMTWDDSARDSGAHLAETKTLVTTMFSPRHN
jgi:putative nucleotidyltransferase with HDIG domain